VPLLVRVDGADQLRHALREKAFLWPPVRRKLIAGAGQAAHKTSQRAAKPHAADKGTLGRNILLEFEDKGLTARVFPARRITGLAVTIEEGRRPGRRPPYGGIKAWMLSHGLISGGRGDSKLIQMMRERIRQSGTRGVGYMAEGAKAAEKVLQQGVPQTEAEVRALWERKT
jgi:hypothetical protein